MGRKLERRRKDGMKEIIRYRRLERANNPEQRSEKRNMVERTVMKK